MRFRRAIPLPARLHTTQITFAPAPTLYPFKCHVIRAPVCIQACVLLRQLDRNLILHFRYLRHDTSGRMSAIMVIAQGNDR